MDKSDHHLAMKHVACNFCGQDRPEMFFTGRDYWYGVGGKFTLQKCSNCGHIYLNPRPTQEEMFRFYPDEYEPYTNYHEMKDRLNQLQNAYFIYKQVRFVSKFLKPGQKVLEVGCSTGEFLYALREKGFEVEGVEPNQTAAAIAQQHYKLVVHNQYFEDCQFEKGAFDAIVMWNVWEHLDDPRQGLRQISSIVKDGGTFIMNVPNPDAIEAKIFGRFWAGWDIPRHLNIFSAQHLVQLFADCRWQVKKIRGFGGRLWLFRLSWSHWKKNAPKTPFFTPFLTKLVDSRLAALIFTPFFMLLEQLNRSSIMGLVAVKEQTGSGS
ncbi:MAG: methyltransferase domain-containing protein [Ardenticatenaceae bacterium]|nr:methyltransferase domain-containing protein [Ardenticatenaceae bacterium]